MRGKGKLRGVMLLLLLLRKIEVRNWESLQWGCWGSRVGAEDTGCSMSVIRLRRSHDSLRVGVLARVEARSARGRGM